MKHDCPGSPEPFERWLVRRVAGAVEAGEVPAALLTELQEEFEAAREKPREESHAAAIRQIANLAGVPVAEARGVLEAIEAQPVVTRELLLRRFADAWLKGQQNAYRHHKEEGLGT